MKAGYRALLSVYMVLMLVLAALAMTYAWGLTDSFDNLVLGLPGGQVILTILGLVWVVFSIVLLFARSRRDEPKGILVKGTDIGHVFISVSALDNLTHRFMKTHPFVKSLTSRIQAVEGGVTLRLRVEVTPNTVIPEVSDVLQNGLKENLETLTGVRVEGISLLFEIPAATTTAVSRVE